MKNVTIVYEIFRREYEYIAILEKELVKRGYNVVIKNKTMDIGIQKCDVLVIPSCYNSKDYEFYRYRFNCKSGKIINLMIEQIYARNASYETPEGYARTIKTLCWGEDRFVRFKNLGIDEKFLALSGPYHADYIGNPDFHNLWLDKKNISEMYNIPLEKKWILFISDFVFSNMNAFAVQESIKVHGMEVIQERNEFELKSQKEILKWFKKILDNPEYVVIYRPHPIEVGAPDLMNMEKECNGRFKVINENNIKQWLYVSDIITMWNSTSIIECYFARKGCLILRPCTSYLVENYPLFDNCKSITTEQSFLDAIKNYNTEDFPIEKSILNKYYDISETCSYKKVCNEIEKLYNSDDVDKIKFYELKKLMWLLKRHIILKIIIKDIYLKIFLRIGKKLGLKKIKRFAVEEWERSVNYKNTYEKVRKLINQ